MFNSCCSWVSEKCTLKLHKKTPPGRNSSGALGWAELRGKTPGLSQDWCQSGVKGARIGLEPSWSNMKHLDDFQRTLQMPRVTCCACLYVVVSPLDCMPTDPTVLSLWMVVLTVCIFLPHWVRSLVPSIKTSIREEKAAVRFKTS